MATLPEVYGGSKSSSIGWCWRHMSDAVCGLGKQNRQRNRAAHLTTEGKKGTQHKEVQKGHEWSSIGEKAGGGSEEQYKSPQGAPVTPYYQLLVPIILNDSSLQSLLQWFLSK